MRVLNFGSLNLDYVYTVDRFVRPGETLAASSRSVKAGAGEKTRGKRSRPCSGSGDDPAGGAGR